MGRVKISLFLVAIVVAVSGLFSGVIQAESNSKSTSIRENLMSAVPLEAIEGTAPTVKKPDWYFNTTIYFTVAKNGATVSDVGEFATLATQTLNDARGWSRLGVKFVQVQSGGTLHLVLAQASLLPSYSSGCTADWSCTVGNTVIINDDRWTNASTAWNAQGGSLRDYRHMVINHETGHWLGHGHEYCSGAGKVAPVMQQQSIDLMGCSFNPWPLASELWTSRF